MFKLKIDRCIQDRAFGECCIQLELAVNPIEEEQYCPAGNILDRVRTRTRKKNLYPYIGHLLVPVPVPVPMPYIYFNKFAQTEGFYICM